MYRPSRLGAMALLAAIFFQAAVCPHAGATNTKLHDFSIKYADGAYPVGQYALNGSALFGFTEYGTSGYGSFVKMTTAGAVTTLVEGTGSTFYQPNAGPILVSGNFYATSYLGGANNKGGVFKITPAGVVSVVVSFGASASDAANPKAGLIYNAADGFLYGTTLYGGTANNGTVFKVKPDGTGYLVIKSFDSTVDCYYPYGGVCLGPDGKLWGATYYAKGFTGGVFKVNTDGTGYTFVYGFGNPDTRGNRPLCDLVKGNDGKLYGTCLYSGANGMGTLFSVDTSSNSVSVVWAFDGYTGANPGFDTWNDPQYHLTVASGTSTFIYGICRFGGLNGLGTVFRLDTSTGIVTLLGSFTLTTANGTANPLTQSGSSFYSTSFYGGSTATAGAGGTFGGYGSAFSCSSTGTIKNIHSFYVRDGYYAEDSPTISIGGYLFGTARDGGGLGWGVVYKVNATTGAYSILHSFNNYYDEGTQPYAGLIKHTDGSMYGCTYGGGFFGNGTLYKITTSGAFTIVHHFRGTLEGWDAYRKLASGYGNDKNLYGICYQGGPAGFGTIFRTNTAGTAFQVIHYFGGASDGSYPGCQLCVEPDTTNNTTKNLYGTTYQGGANNYGTLFRISPSGSSFSKLMDLAYASGGQSYYNGPIVLIAGVLYGDLYVGGANGSGAIWKYDLGTSTYSNVFSFNNANPAYQGSNPVGGVSADGSGNLYGTCRVGGAFGYGTVWKYATGTNTYTKLHDFGGQPATDGGYPYGGVVFDSTTGLLYGSTEQGGTFNYGTVFSQTTSP